MKKLSRITRIRLMKLSINILINVLIKHFRICAILMVIKKGKKEQERDENLLKETVKKVIFDYGMIISVTLPHILKIYFDDDLE